MRNTQDPRLMNLRKKKGTLAMITRLSKFLKMMKSPLYKKKKPPHTHTHTHTHTYI